MTPLQVAVRSRWGATIIKDEHHGLIITSMRAVMTTQVNIEFSGTSWKAVNNIHNLPNQNIREYLVRITNELDDNYRKNDPVINITTLKAMQAIKDDNSHPWREVEINKILTLIQKHMVLE